MIKKGKTVSVSVIFVIIFMYVITNVAYYFFTQKALINEANKRLDTTAEYVKQYLTQVKANDANETKIVQRQMKITSSLIAKDVGSTYVKVNQKQIDRLKQAFDLKSLNVIPHPDRIHLDMLEVGNHEYRYQYSTQQLDYTLDFTMDNNTNDKYSYVNEHLSELLDNHVNLYQGKRITLEISLFQKPENPFISLKDMQGYGSYTYLNENDVPFLNQALDKQYVSYYTNVDHLKLEKYFMHFEIENQIYVMCLISDFQIMQKVLTDQVIFYVYAIAIGTAVFIVLCALIIKTIRKNKAKEIASVHDSYENSMETINLSLKQQRHDYNNTIATIRALVTMKQYEGLEKYTGELIEDTMEFNELLNINCPPLMALLQTKHSLANQNGVDLYDEILDFDSIPKFKYKIHDIVRVLSNLIDNSFEAVMSRKSENVNFAPQISVIGYLEEDFLIFSVRNNGSKIPDHEAHLILEPGYSSKKNGSGLGLSIIIEILNKNNGYLTYVSDEESTTFRAYFKIQT
ncbi:GHKL domain-containing protein [Paenibacillus sp. HJL G12]|uniref:GHKL domain-containing protein n=1 Tax=Paenibacillus dendrobii TaxID=2691084 RepID=A0A7X3LH59_9BACL|nr:ATP-binding protein [Paenibacillus dendrobii]MWV42859.1 GHKL domain-containing protein [Paenibacillus dendrobii]